MTDELDAKITLRSVLKLVAGALAIGGLWATMVYGQKDNTARLIAIEGHVARIDTSLAVARALQVTRLEVQELVRRADSTHSSIRSDIKRLEERIGRF